MVIDDSLVFRSFLSNSLRKFDEFEVVGTAMNGKAALSSIPLLNPAVCTLDIEMPVMNGIETLKEIKSKYPGIQVIMVSSRTSEGAEITLQAMELGAADFVLKEASDPSTESDHTQTLPLILSQKIKRAYKNSSFSRKVEKNTILPEFDKPRSPSLQNLIIPGTKPLFLSVS